MKRFFLPLFAASLFMLTGCLENTQEITINDDGSGILNTTSDMSGLIAFAKQSAGDKMSEMPDEKIDTSISLAGGVDSIEGLSADEKEIMKTGTLKIDMDISAEKMVFGMNFPFKTFSEIGSINKLSSKVLTDAIKKQTGGDGEGLGGPEMPEASSMDDYFTIDFSNGVVEKKLNTEKYAGVESDQFLAAMKQMGSMGLLMKNTYIINLPRPATKAEGKSVTLSDDKKKATITADINDFFDEASKLEYRIEY
jgi:hypothetical protein